MSATPDFITTLQTRGQSSDDTADRWMTRPNQHACLDLTSNQEADDDSDAGWVTVTPRRKPRYHHIVQNATSTSKAYRKIIPDVAYHHIEHKSSITHMRMNPECLAREPGTTQLPVADPTPIPSSLTLDQSSLCTHCASEENCDCGNYRPCLWGTALRALPSSGHTIL
jgi:hypothetical protein